MLDSSFLYGNTLLYITIVLYITHINLEYVLGNFDPHRVLGPLPHLYKKDSFFVSTASDCLLFASSVMSSPDVRFVPGNGHNWMDFT